MKYPLEVKQARMQAVADALNSGEKPPVLEIGTEGMAQVLVRHEITQAIEIEGDRLLVITSPIESQCIGEGDPKSARLLGGDGAVVVEDLKAGPDAEVQIEEETYHPNQTVRVKRFYIIHP